MTNKKLWLSLLAVVLIVCMLSVGLMSCKKNVDDDEEEEEEEEETVEELAANAIIEGIQKSMAAGEMTDLKVQGEVELKINEEAYKLALALDLDLLQHKGWNYTNCTSSSTFNSKEKYFTYDDEAEEYVEAKDLDAATFNGEKTKYFTRSKKEKETSAKSNTFLTAELSKGDQVLLGVYYWDSDKNIPSTDTTVFYSDTLYVQVYDKETETMKQMMFPAPFINATMRAYGASVDFHEIKLEDLDVWTTIGGVLPIIASMADPAKTEFEEGSKASITLNLASVLNKFASVLGSAGGYVKALGLDLDTANLGTILPAISITLAATFEQGVANGVDLSLNIENKDLEIKKVKNGEKPQETFLKLNIPGEKEVKLGLGLNYKLGVATPIIPEDIEDWTFNNNIIDLDLSTKIDIAEDIKISLSDSISIDIPAGKYKLKLSGQINPFVILGEINNFDFSGIAGIISTVKTILGAIEGLDLELIQEYNKAGTKVDNTVLLAILATQYQKTTTGDNYTKKSGGIKATVTTSLLNGYSLPVIQGMDIENLIKTVQNAIVALVKDKADESPSVEGEEGEEEKKDIMPTLKAIGAYLIGAYIGINDGEDGHGKIFASFDTDKTKDGFIPFDGYTKWSGKPSDAAQEKWTFYTLTKGTYDHAPATYDAKETYYTKHGNYARKVVTTGDDAEVFNPTRQYYTSKVGADPTEAQLADKTNFEKADITEFANGTTYFVWVQEEYWTEAVKDSTEYNSKKANLYVRTADSYNVAETISDGVEYYVRGFNDITYSYNTDGTVKVNDKGEPIIASRGDFGIDLAATLNIDWEKGEGLESLDIVIDATKIANLDVIGLPAEFSAKIYDIDVELWQNDPIILIVGDPDAHRLSEIKAKIINN